jgi:hypothetical protein
MHSDTIPLPEDSTIGGVFLEAEDGQSGKNTDEEEPNFCIKALEVLLSVAV